MFRSRQFVVDAGANHVASGAFSTRPGGKLVLEEFALEFCSSDPSRELGWVERTAQALVSVGVRWKTRGPATFVMPGHLTLTKFVKTPAVGRSKRGKVIHFEAAQNIPYPLEAVAWDHLVIAGDDLELEIMLTAVKLEVMESLCAAAEAAGFPVKRAAASCLALHHAFRYNYPSVSGPVLVADIGARSTTLLLVGADGRFFARTFALAGNAVTAVMADELHIDFAHAEALKLGTSHGREISAEGESVQAALQRATDNFLNRLQLEISRTVGNFAARTGADAPVVIYLTGGGSLLVGLNDALSGKLGIPVDRFDPLREVELSAAAVETGAVAATHLLANLIGLAAPEAGKLGERPNLVPAARRAIQGFRRRQVNWVGAATLVVVGLLAPLGYLRASAANANVRAAEMQARLLPAQALANRNSANLALIAVQQDRIAAVQKAIASRTSWVEFLGELQQRLATIEDVWLEEVMVAPTPSPHSSGLQKGEVPATPLQLRLSGRLLDTHNPLAKVSRDSYERVKRLLGGLTGSRFVASVGEERFDNSQAGLLRFDFLLAVNPRHPL